VCYQHISVEPFREPPGAEASAVRTGAELVEDFPAGTTEFSKSEGL
jgi:hypothetical protein